MDCCAELTLRMVRLAQEALQPLSSASGWLFFPEQQPIRWSQARDRLTSAQKPLIVAAMLEPGSLLAWSVKERPAPEQVASALEFENQREYFDQKLGSLGLQETNELTLAGTAGTCRIPVAEFRRWYAEYALPDVGIFMMPSANRSAGWLLVRRPGGGEPVGYEDTRS